MANKTAWDESTRAELKRRADTLTETSKPQWGKMNCKAMLAHVSDGVAMAIGELDVASRESFLRFRPVRYLIIHKLPFPKGAPTAPELIAREAEDIEEEKQRLSALLERFAQKEKSSEWPPHPAFGKLTPEDWGVLIHKHIDHHFRQFGV